MDLSEASVPTARVLDPDGDIVRYLNRAGWVRRDADWACYHSELHRTEEQGYRARHPALRTIVVNCRKGLRYLSPSIAAKRNNLTVFLTVKALSLQKLR
jgi:hypothetical protein